MPLTWIGIGWNDWNAANIVEIVVVMAAANILKSRKGKQRHWPRVEGTEERSRDFFEINTNALFGLRMPALRDLVNPLLVGFESGYGCCSQQSLWRLNELKIS